MPKTKTSTKINKINKYQAIQLVIYSLIVLLIIVGVYQLATLLKPEGLFGKAINVLEKDTQITLTGTGGTLEGTFKLSEGNCIKMTATNVVAGTIGQLDIVPVVCPLYTGTVPLISLPYTNYFSECNLGEKPSPDWTVLSIGDDTTSNWICSNETLNKYARFKWVPTHGKFDSLFVTSLDMSKYEDLTIQWKQNYAVPTTIDISNPNTIGLYVYDTSWNKEILYEETPIKTISGLKEFYLSSTTLKNQNINLRGTIKLGFNIRGENTVYTDYYDIDDIHICEGKPPVMTIDGLNTEVVSAGIIFADTNKSLQIAATDTEDNVVDTVTLNLVDGLSFVSIENNQLVISPITTSLGDYSVNVVASDGCLETYKTITFTVASSSVEYIVYQPEKVYAPMITALADSITANDRKVQVISTLADYKQFPNLKAIFVPLGIYGSYKHSLTPEEVTLLVDYLKNGGRLYIEGGDFFYDDSKTNIHGYLKISGVSSGNLRMSDKSPLIGLNFLDELNYDITKVDAYLYDTYLDHIDKAFASTAVLIQQGGSGDNLFGTAVAYEGVALDPTKVYRTIGASVPFASLVQRGGGYLPAELMFYYLEFFENGFPQCTLASECDDTNQCTTDSCNKGSCVHTPIEGCAPCQWDQVCGATLACDKTTSVCEQIPGTEYASKDTPLYINNANPIRTSTITIPDNKIIKNINAKIKMTHTYRGDLKITLTHGSNRVILKKPDMADAKPGWYYTYDLGKDVDDSTLTMDAFNGDSIFGDWVLIVEDTDKFMNDGTLQGWSLFIEGGLEGDVCKTPTGNFADCGAGYTCTGTCESGLAGYLCCEVAEACPSVDPDFELASCKGNNWQADTYILTKDLSPDDIILTLGACMRPDVDNVVIDCCGHKIIGATTGIGIHSIGNSIIIKNCHIEGFSEGMRINGDYSKVLYNSFNNNQKYGIYNLLGISNDFTGNNACNNADYDFYCSDNSNYNYGNNNVFGKVLPCSSNSWPEETVSGGTPKHYANACPTS